jgi:hypothetical protein
MTARQRELVRSCKERAPADGVASIPIRDEVGELLGSLTAVRQSEADDLALCESLTRWRQMFRKYFLTQFEPTPDRTQRWLQNVVLPDDTRILFLIRDETLRPVGNFGVCGISETCAELDNLIRGERGGHVRLIFYAEVNLLAWCFTQLNVSHMCLHVFQTNSRTISLHDSVGFGEHSRRPLWQLDGPDEVKLVTEPGAEARPTGIELVRMELSRDEFLARHAWALGAGKGPAWIP